MQLLLAAPSVVCGRVLVQKAGSAEVPAASNAGEESINAALARPMGDAMSTVNLLLTRYDIAELVASLSCPLLFSNVNAKHPHSALRTHALP